jgi:hypothetical protein
MGGCCLGQMGPGCCWGQIGSSWSQPVADLCCLTKGHSWGLLLMVSYTPSSMHRDRYEFSVNHLSCARLVLVLVDNGVRVGSSIFPAVCCMPAMISDEQHCALAQDTLGALRVQGFGFSSLLLHHRHTLCVHVLLGFSNLQAPSLISTQARPSPAPPPRGPSTWVPTAKPCSHQTTSRH